MQVDTAPRQQGKTSRLAQWALDAPPDERRIIVCLNQREAERVKHTYIGVEAISADRVKDFSPSPNVRFGVDDAGVLLERFLRSPVARAAISGTPV